jgi:kynurenine aminotransferase
VLVNMKKVKLPENYEFPANVKDRPRDFKLSWFLISEVGVAAIPPTGKFSIHLLALLSNSSLLVTSTIPNTLTEFYTPERAHLAEDYLRFAVCKNDDVLETAKERLRGLKKYIFQ